MSQPKDTLMPSGEQKLAEKGATGRRRSSKETLLKFHRIFFDSRCFPPQQFYVFLDLGMRKFK